jgi:hypothetical protein
LVGDENNAITIGFTDQQLSPRAGSTRFWVGCDLATSPAAFQRENLRCFRPPWHWGLDRLPSQKEGHTLDLNSTRRLHKDGR